VASVQGRDSNWEAIIVYCCRLVGGTEYSYLSSIVSPALRPMSQERVEEFLF